MADISLSAFVELDGSDQADIMETLRKQSTNNNDRIAQIKLLFCEALEAACNIDTSPIKNGIKDSDEPKQEDVLASNLKALALFNTAFCTMRDKDNSVFPEEMLEDFVFVRAVYTRLHRSQAALSLRIAETMAQDLRHFATTHGTTLPPARFNNLMNLAYGVPTVTSVANRERGNPILESLRQDKEKQARIDKNGQLTPTADADGTIW